MKSLTCDDISNLIARFVEISSTNKINIIQKKITRILSNLILLKNSSKINYEE